MGAAPWVRRLLIEGRNCCQRSCVRVVARVGFPEATIDRAKQGDSANNELYTLSVNGREGRTPVKHFRRVTQPVMPGLRERKAVRARWLDVGWSSTSDEGPPDPDDSHADRSLARGSKPDVRVKERVTIAFALASGFDETLCR